MHYNLIKLNIQLMRLPEELIDYIILHELAHIEEKNHQRGFYELLFKLCPDAGILRKKMKKYHPKKYL